MPAGAVLCGGSSRRMGRDKALVEVDGVAMAARVVNALRGIGCEQVALVGGEADSRAALGGEYVADVVPGQGPVGGIVSALRRFASTDLVFIVACDVPYLTSTTLQLLVDRFDSDTDGDIDVVLARTDRIEPLCAAWRPRVLPAVEQLFDSGERAVQAIVAALNTAVVDVDPLALRNVNAADDLAQ